MSRIISNNTSSPPDLIAQYERHLAVQGELFAATLDQKEEELRLLRQRAPPTEDYFARQMETRDRRIDLYCRMLKARDTQVASLRAKCGDRITGDLPLDISKCHQQIFTMGEELQHLQTEVALLEKSLVAKEKALSSLAGKSDEGLAALELSSRAIGMVNGQKELRAELHKAQERNKELLNENSALLERVNDVEKSQAEGRRESTAVAQVLSSRESTINRLDKLLRESKEEASKLKDALESERKISKGELNNKIEEVQMLRLQLDEIQNSFQRKNEEFGSLQNRSSRLGAEGEVEREKRKEAETLLRASEAQIDSLVEKCSRLELRNSALSRQVGDLEAALGGRSRKEEICRITKAIEELSPRKLPGKKDMHVSSQRSLASVSKMEYVAYPGDEIDQALSRWLNFSENCEYKHKFCRMGKGYYLFGTSRIFIRIVDEILPNVTRLEALVCHNKNEHWIRMEDLVKGN